MQGAGDRQHLLLAAGELGALVRPALGEARKRFVDAADGPRAGPLDRNQQVLVHGQVGEDAPPLRHIADARLGDPVGGKSGHVRAEQRDPAGARAGEADQAAQRRRLPRAVAAKQRDDLALAHFEAHAVQDVALAIESMDALGLERDHAAALPR